MLDTENSIQIVVEHSGGPTISSISNQVDGPSASITWNTNIPTTGYVVYEVGGNPAGKLKAMATSSNSYKVWLPGTTPRTEYSYYILATNPGSGATTVSERQTVTTGAGVQIGMSNAKVKSSTEAVISYAAQDFATAAVEYAQVDPGITTIQWQRAQHTYKDQEHKFTLTSLQPNSEYVYRIVSSEDNTWACSTKSRFDWFATKTSGPSVSFVDLENRQGVSSLSTVTVRAGDAQHRFSTYGITNVELLIDGESATQFTKTTATDHVDYTFDLSGLNLGNGVHRLVATAYDDYWQTSDARIEVLLDAEIGGSSAMQTRSLHAASTMTILSNEGTAGNKGTPKKQRYLPVVCWKCYCVVRGMKCARPSYIYNDGSPVYLSTIGHSFLILGRPEDTITQMHWHGFAGSGVALKSPGVVRLDEKKGENFYYYLYEIWKTNRTEVEAAIKCTEVSGSRHYTYALFPNPPETHNCASWLCEMLMDTHIAPFIMKGDELFYPGSPAQIVDYSYAVNDARKKKQSVVHW